MGGCSLLGACLWEVSLRHMVLWYEGEAGLWGRFCGLVENGGCVKVSLGFDVAYRDLLEVVGR